MRRPKLALAPVQAQEPGQAALVLGLVPLEVALLVETDLVATEAAADLVARRKLHDESTPNSN
jgi:hypothetical protein